MASGGISREPITVPRVETRWRRIVTPIPVPESLPLLKRLDRFESVSMHGQLPIVWDRAEDVIVEDRWGNRWLDFTSTIFVTNAGHGNPRIIQALRDVLDRPLLHTYTYSSEIRADYLEYLIENTPDQFEKAFLLSAGTEAVECVLKLMRMWGQNHGKRRGGVIGFEGNWHGRTMGAEMLGDKPANKTWMGYHDPNIHHMPFPYPWRDGAGKDPGMWFEAMFGKLCMDKQLLPERDICGMIFETYQGWGSVFYPPEFVQAAAEFAQKYNFLIAFDEMQSGFGRTGTLFGYQHYGVEPDLLACGKGAGSSLPLSLVLGSREVMDLPAIGSMSSTHSANPMVCAAGLANLQALLEDGILENGAAMGEHFQKRLHQIKDRFNHRVGWVLGKGLVAAMLFEDPEGKPLSNLATRVCELCMQRGLLLVHTGIHSIKLAPPLTIGEEALLEGLEVYEQAVADAVAERITD
ncbi:MAG: aminotransferase class III-fold pyridoxal phosphate-dependent enzyme [Acidobacteriota bacterium]|nr:aminotransferase class III-fold pyridoxal phosphate-dependent enzyme [Acidobacteriota bacterium]